MLIDMPTFLYKKMRLSGQHYGIVVNNRDEMKLGYVQVRIPGVIDGKEEDLPWAAPRLPAGFGGALNAQGFVVPKEGSDVTLEFGNDPYTLFYTGWVPSEISSSEELTDGAGDNYPDVYGSLDDQGTGYVVDQVERSFDWGHASGFKSNVDSSGNASMVSDGDLTLQFNNVTIEATGKFTVNGTETIDLFSLEGLNLTDNGETVVSSVKGLKVRSVGTNEILSGISNRIQAGEQNELSAGNGNIMTTLKGNNTIDAQSGSNTLTASANNTLRANTNKLIGRLQQLGRSMFEGAMQLKGSFASRGTMRNNNRDVGSTHKHLADGKPTTPPI